MERAEADQRDVAAATRLMRVFLTCCKPTAWTSGSFSQRVSNDLRRWGLRILHHLRALTLGMLTAPVAAALSSVFKPEPLSSWKTLRSGTNWAFCIAR